MSVDGLRCILYARIYILYMHTILYYCIQTGGPPVAISSELKLKTNSWLAQYLSYLFLKDNRIRLYHIIRQTVPNINHPAPGNKKNISLYHIDTFPFAIWIYCQQG